MRTLKNELTAGDGVLYVFYDFETTQNINIRIGQRYTFPISSACSSSVLDARTWKKPSEITSGVASGSIRSGTIPSATC